MAETRTGWAKACVALGRGDGAGLDHLVEHDGGAPLGPVGVGDRAVAGRALHQPGQQRRLAELSWEAGLLK